MRRRRTLQPRRRDRARRRAPGWRKRRSARPGSRCESAAMPTSATRHREAPPRLGTATEIGERQVDQVRDSERSLGVHPVAHGDPEQTEGHTADEHGDEHGAKPARRGRHIGRHRSDDGQRHQRSHREHQRCGDPPEEAHPRRCPERAHVSCVPAGMASASTTAWRATT